MKLLMVTPYYYPKIGGLENYVKNLVEQLLRESDIDVCVITSNHTSRFYEKIIHSRRFKVYRLPYEFVLSNTPISFNWYNRIKKIISDENPHIIHAHTPVPFMADVAALATKKTPFILTYHAGSMKKNKFIPDLLINFYENVILKQLLSRANKIILNTNRSIPEFLAAHQSKLTFIPPGVNTKLFVPPINRKLQHKILYVGKVEKSAEYKGINYLLKAVEVLKRELKDIRLNIVGGGSAINMYKNYCIQKEIGKNVSFLGEISDKKIINLYRNSDVLVLPSTTEAESFGMVLIEAMACGLPVIGSDIGGIPHVIDHNKNGLLVKPKDFSAIAKAIKYLFDNPDKSIKMGKAARKKVMSKFRWEITAEAYKNIYREYEK